MSTTTLYLVRHGATFANLQRPYLLQGQQADPPLAPAGVRQAQLTQLLLAGRSLRQVYASPLLRARQTAEILAQPHGLPVQIVPALIECDVGRWEGKSWEAIRQEEPEAGRRFEQDPAVHGYPDGENFADVACRIAPAFAQLLARHAGEEFLVVSHHIVNRIYLAGLLGLVPGQAKLVKLDNCGVSVIRQDGDQPWVATLNAVFHLSEARAA
jgi:broad specificity phosphatase PhoE